MVRDGLWICLLPLRMQINRDRLILNLELSRLYEQVVRPTWIQADFAELYMVL
jgi:hypothetical protein